ncbi:hypothetical protein SJPD1_1862 [Sulfurospirillum diekertiae]|uniref:Uncharacterized protein n=1 Tax=Sulfurospirillum diekertiae TaxID=1854492 RepID=A0A290HEV7_9BACT|nr:hypothetical protein [Sulfurospirillum diekertiae]ATB69967.1 hypothetical protein SJPD1_1862 [Sulfurospirillum diekertiae]
MYPQLLKKSYFQNDIYEDILTVIKSLESQDYFDELIGKSQPEQKEMVKKFQKDLFLILTERIVDVRWELEYQPKSARRDAIDIYGKAEGFIIIIELDKHRADQVAKKFISRSALFANEKTFYISLCYPGTEKMSKPETIKYFEYCQILSEKIGHHYAGFII